MKLQIFVGKDGQHYIRLVGRNRKTMMVSEGYASMSNAKRAANRFNSELFWGYLEVEIV